MDIAQYEQLPPLSDREERFCQEMVVDFDRARSIKEAGYDVGTRNAAFCQARLLMKKPQIQARLRELQQDYNAELFVTRERLLEQLITWVFTPIDAIVRFEDGGEMVLKPSREITPQAFSCIKKIKCTRVVTENDRGSRTEKVTSELELVDKESRFDKLCEMLGIDRNPDELVRAVVKAGLTPAHLADMAMGLELTPEKFMHAMAKAAAERSLEAS